MAAAEAEQPGDLAYVQNILAQQGTVSSGQFRTRHNKRQKTSGHSKSSKPRLRVSSQYSAVPDAFTGEQTPTLRRAHCSVCDCNVGAGSQSWQIHVEGIKHRRRALSLQHTGSTDHLITSAFEDPQGEDACWNRRTPATRPRPACADTPISWTCPVPRIGIQALKLLRDLVDLSGGRSHWNQNSWRFTEASLQEWADEIHTHSHLHPDRPLALLTGDHTEWQHLPHPDCGFGTCWAMLAHAPNAVLTQQLRLLRGKLVWRFPGSMNGLPAAIVAFFMMAQRMQGSSELHEWHLDFGKCSGASKEQLAPCQRMMMQAMRGLMQQPGALRRLQCTSWYDILPDDWNQKLRDIQRLAMRQRKKLILCGALSSVCKASPLQCLPLGPLKMVLDDACGPRSICAIFGALNFSL